MINYNKLAREWFMNVIITDAENMGESYTQIEKSMFVDYGDDFDMEKFVDEVVSIESKLTDLLSKGEL